MNPSLQVTTQLQGQSTEVAEGGGGVFVCEKTAMSTISTFSHVTSTPSQM